MEYIAKGLFKNNHFNTCYPTFFRKIHVDYRRERLELEDGDFIDIDRIFNNSDSAVILCHGLEGSSQSKYIIGMAKQFSIHNWDIIAMNYRSCSGEINRKPLAYYFGATHDLEAVIELAKKTYKNIFLIGFSFGAELILNYLGKTSEYPDNLKGAAVVSPPCDLKGVALRLSESENTHYSQSFTTSILEKVQQKKEIIPEVVDFEKLVKVQNMIEFDEEFTIKILGHKTPFEYYDANSSKPNLTKIKTPTLILTPKDDPLMSESCYPFEEAKSNQHLKLVTPEHGGHIGFADFSDFPYWHEEFIYRYVKDELELIPKSGNQQ